MQILSTRLSCNENHKTAAKGARWRAGWECFISLADQQVAHSVIKRTDRNVDIGCVGLARLLRASKHFFGRCIYMYT